MKLHEALRQIVRQSGTQVLQEQRLMYLLPDYRAYDEYPAVKQVMKAIIADGYAKGLYARGAGAGRPGYLNYAGRVKQSLVADRHFSQEFADYAVDSISFALGVISSVKEPSDHGFDPFENGGHGGSQQQNGGGTGWQSRPGTGGSGWSGQQQQNGGQGWQSQSGTVGNGSPQQPASGGQRAHDSAASPWLVPDWDFVMTSEPLKVFWCAVLGCAWIAIAMVIVCIVIKVTDGHAHGGALGYAGGKIAKGVLCLVLGGFFYGSDSIGTLAEKIIAKHGKVWAMMNLGNRYFTGNGASQKYSEAAKWYLQAAVQGNAKAQFLIGMMYRDGMGVGQSLPDAVKWITQAAGSGNADAEYSLGEMYGSGTGVRQDYAESARWYAIAAQQYRMDASNGSVRAGSILGRMYESGTGVRQDYAEAAGWYLKAGMQGEKSAQYSLGEMYESGRGVAKDMEEAKKWYGMAAKAFKKAAKAGDAAAQTGLGVMYEKGHGVWQSFRSAAKWYRKAADQGYGYAGLLLDAMRKGGKIKKRG